MLVVSMFVTVGTKLSIGRATEPVGMLVVSMLVTVGTKLSIGRATEGVRELNELSAADGASD
jgi:hypothetical protein